MNILKQVCGDTQKFDKKIVGKEFLLGKYFQANKETKKQKDKKYTRSKLEKLLEIQQKITGKYINFQFYLPLHELWKSYMSDLLSKDHNQESIYIKILRSDFHGAFISILHSKIDSYIGLQGIIYNQSLKTFKIVTKNNKSLRIIKEQIVFQINIMNKYFVVNGNCLIFRSSDRAKHKFKSKKAQKINLQLMQKIIQD